MLIRAKAPLRLSFAGGGTDIPPYPQMEGGCVLSATIARYVYGSLRPRQDEQIHIHSLDYGLSLSYESQDRLVYDGNLDMAKAAIRRLCSRRQGGLELFLHSEAPPGSGLGSSSAVMVTMIGLLKEFQGLYLTKHQVAEMAVQMERVELGIQGGLQDQYASSFGGFNFIQFLSDDVLVEPLTLAQGVLNELEHNILLCYTGGTRLSAGIIQDQVARYNSPESLALLRELKALTLEMKECLLQRRLEEFSRLMHEEWMRKKRLSPLISTPQMDAIYQAALEAGALAGKGSGAGGGGYFILYCEFERKQAVAQAVEALGGKVADFTFCESGLKTWQVAGKEQGNDRTGA